MKSEDITAIATTTIAITLIVGTVFYIQGEFNIKRLREEKMDKIELKRKEKSRIKEKKVWDKLQKEGMDKRRMDKIYKKYKSDKEACKSSISSFGEYLKCMSEKGYREKFIKKLY